MNIIDFVILAVLAVSVIFGLYRGFISGVLSVAAVVGSAVFAFAAGGRLAAWLSGNQTLVDTLLYYTDAGSRISDLNLALMNVGSLSEQALTQVLKSAGLPAAFEAAFVERLSGAAPAVTVSELMSQTIVGVSISILSFLICFLVAFIALSFLIHLISYVFELPVLRHLDALIGGAFGLARGVLLVFIFFAVVPIVLAVAPIEQLNQLIAGSTLAPYFDSRLILNILKGGL